MDHAIGLRLDSTFQAYLLACRRLRTEREADRLVDLLVGVVDPTLRLHRFGEHLRSRSVEETVRRMVQLMGFDLDVSAEATGDRSETATISPTPLAPAAKRPST